MAKQDTVTIPRKTYLDILQFLRVLVADQSRQELENASTADAIAHIADKLENHGGS